MQVSNVNELMIAASRAAKVGDVGTLCDLQDQVRGWLQSDEERDAQLEMLETMQELAEMAED